MKIPKIFELPPPRSVQVRSITVNYSLRPMNSSLQHAVPPGLQSPQHGRVEVPGDPAVFFEVEKSMAEVICLRMMM